MNERQERATISTLDIASQTGNKVSEVRAAAILSGARATGYRNSQDLYTRAESDRITDLLKTYSAPPRKEEKPKRPDGLGDPPHSLDRLNEMIGVIAASTPSEKISYKAMLGLYHDKTGRHAEDDVQALASGEIGGEYAARAVRRAGGVSGALSKAVVGGLRAAGKELSV